MTEGGVTGGREHLSLMGGSPRRDAVSISASSPCSAPGYRDLGRGESLHASLGGKWVLQSKWGPNEEGAPGDWYPDGPVPRPYCWSHPVLPAKQEAGREPGPHTLVSEPRPEPGPKPSPSPRCLPPASLCPGPPRPPRGLRRQGPPQTREKFEVIFDLYGPFFPYLNA